ncbi:helix-turn-helix domain-containing protein [Ramlibacter albus]|uniref:Helix-turn-helix transcriptional regulator n=1 Tax=Ramlibacter albus TaxID=2079448 RepID=A0A923M721_9BURK|nr:helix-turn-helix transcriptional regulator [Ramlibacter albus]MBC5764956.1 helix-turn-helix transcriptional regulator [Ramlibacter albus]
MANSTALLDALKRELRARKVTYARVAEHLQLSEASVKRLFAQNDLSLPRIDATCALLGIEFTDLAAAAVARTNVISQMTLEQEQELVEDPKLMLVACAVLSYWTMDHILAHYDLTRAECIELLARLDRLKLIELQPNNRYRLRTSAAFRWIPDGPFQQQFRKYAQMDYFQSHFNGENELMVQVFGSLAAPSRAALLARLKNVAHEFTEMNQQDGPLPLQEKSSMTLVLAVRPWEPRNLRALRRKAKR